MKLKRDDYILIEYLIESDIKQLRGKLHDDDYASSKQQILDMINERNQVLNKIKSIRVEHTGKREIVICSKCNSLHLEDEAVWCNTCGISYCKECAVIGLPNNYPLPSNILDDVADVDEWTGDLGFVMDECANCYNECIDEDEPISNIKYTKDDICKIK